MIDRSEINRALAKAIAFKQCGKERHAAAWAAELVRLLDLANILQLGYQRDLHRALELAEEDRTARDEEQQPQKRKAYPGYRTMTAAQRRNARMERIFEDAKARGDWPR